MDAQQSSDASGSASALPAWGACRVLDHRDCTPPGFKWLSLHLLQYEDQQGRTFSWEAVKRQPRGDASNGCDGVAVLAKIVSRSRPAQVPVVVQFRPPLGCLSVELPAGLVDPGEGVEATALRELREETGYVGRVTAVSPPLAESPGMTNSCCKIALVEVDGDAPGNAAPQPCPESHAGEVLTCELLPHDSLAEGLLQLVGRLGGPQACVLDSRLYALALGLRLGLGLGPGLQPGSASPASALGGCEGCGAEPGPFADADTGSGGSGGGGGAGSAGSAGSGASVHDMGSEQEAGEAPVGPAPGGGVGAEGCGGDSGGVPGSAAAVGRCTGGRASAAVPPRLRLGLGLELPQTAAQAAGGAAGFHAPGAANGVRAGAVFTAAGAADGASSLGEGERCSAPDEDLGCEIAGSCVVSTAGGAGGAATAGGAGGGHLPEGAAGPCATAPDDASAGRGHARRGARGGRWRRGRGRRERDSPQHAPDGEPPPPHPHPKPRGRGRSTVGGGGRKGFAGSNAGPAGGPGFWGRGGRSGTGLRGAVSTARGLLDMQGWARWGAADPVARGCGAVLLACALTTGLLAARVYMQRSRAGAL